MADINIEKKKSSIWPWIIGLVLLAAVAWLAWTMLAQQDEPEVDPLDTQYQAPAPAPAPAPVPMDTMSMDTLAPDTAPPPSGP